MSLDVQTLENAVRKYLVKGIEDYLGESFWRPLNRQDVRLACRSAIRRASEETDKLALTYEIDDHCTHWLMDVTFVHSDGVKTFEFPMNRLHPDELPMIAVEKFLTALLSAAVKELPMPIMTPTTIEQVAVMIDAQLLKCEGCSANVMLQEAKMSRGNVDFVFLVTFAIGAGGTTKIAFSVPWPQA